MKALDWVARSMQRLHLIQRNSLTCECGAGGCELSNPPDCTQYKVATCIECARKWAIFLGKKK